MKHASRVGRVNALCCDTLNLLPPTPSPIPIEHNTMVISTRSNVNARIADRLLRSVERSEKR